MKGKKRQNCAYCWWDLCQTFCLMNTQTPALMLLIHVQLPQKGGFLLDTQTSGHLVHQRLFFFFAAVAIVSPIYRWAKNTIISKINATLSQNNEQINNNQVVFLYCICTVYTQRVTFVVYMYTNNWQSCFRLGF